MAKKPEHRFQTPADMAAELSFLFGTTLPAAPPTSGLIALTALKPSKLTKPMPRPSASQLHGAPLSAAANVLAPAGAHWKTLQTGLPEPPKVEWPRGGATKKIENPG